MWYRFAQDNIEDKPGKRFPWFNNPEEIERRGFDVKPVGNDRFLVTPKPSKFKWDYNPDDPYGETSELNWRSSLLNKKGEEISGGLPKFMNFGESKEESGNFNKIDRTITQAISNHNALLTLKEDGSLIIRSVYKGEVIIRTRGSSKISDSENFKENREEILDLINKKYRILLDPSFLSSLDLFFEYISPKNPIIIKYEEPELIFLHAKERKTQQLVNWDKLDDIANNYGFKLVPIVKELNEAKSAQELKSIINKLENEGSWPHEGVVVRSPEGYMSKIKGDEYLKQHKIKSHFNYGFLVEICETNNINDLNTLKQFLIDNYNADWEILSGLEDMFNEYIIRKNKFNQLIKDSREYVENWLINNVSEDMTPKEIKKKFAIEIKDIPSDLRFTLFMMFGNKISNEDISRGLEKLFKIIVIDQ